MSSLLSKTFVSLCILMNVNNAHMSMQFPVPRGSPGYAKWKHNEPMIPAHPQICHGITPDSTVRAENVCYYYIIYINIRYNISLLL